MASTSPALATGLAVLTGTGVLSGQGPLPIARARYSTVDASLAPVWNELPYASLRAFTTSRGRDSELQAFDAGTASLTLDNRNRNFDPNFNAAISPFNRWWLYEEFSGEVHDIFRGYAESYENHWPDGSWSNAEAVVNLSDEFKALNLWALPHTDPPRAGYSDSVAFDSPVGFWRLNQTPTIQLQPPQTPPVPKHGGDYPGWGQPGTHYGD